MSSSALVSIQKSTSLPIQETDNAPLDEHLKVYFTDVKEIFLIYQIYQEFFQQLDTFLINVSSRVSDFQAAYHLPDDENISQYLTDSGIFAIFSKIIHGSTKEKIDRHGIVTQHKTHYISIISMLETVLETLNDNEMDQQTQQEEALHGLRLTINCINRIVKSNDEYLILIKNIERSIGGLQEKLTEKQQELLSMSRCAEVSDNKSKIFDVSVTNDSIDAYEEKDNKFHLQTTFKKIFTSLTIDKDQDDHSREIQQVKEERTSTFLQQDLENIYKGFEDFKRHLYNFNEKLLSLPEFIEKQKKLWEKIKEDLEHKRDNPTRIEELKLYFGSLLFEFQQLQPLVHEFSIQMFADTELASHFSLLHRYPENPIIKVVE